MDVKYKWINNISIDGKEVHISFCYSDGLGTESLDIFKHQLETIYKEVFK